MRSFVYAERTLVGLNRIVHWHFTSFGYLASKISTLFGENEFSRHGYETIVKITMDYLQSISTNPSGHDFLPTDTFHLIDEVEHHDAYSHKE